ncbi:MAG: maleylpyruvate isomerase family mycothiol-dependent enzyme, partial [Mycobacterium sp.]
MESQDFVNHLRSDAAAFVEACRKGEGLGAPVPACPGWDVAKLALHLGIVHQWQGAIVSTAAQGPPDMSTFARAPDGPARIDWLEDNTRELLLALGACDDPSEPMWNFSGANQTASFWFRRSAQETAVHRWDAQQAAGRPRPVDPDLAVDGIEELLDVLLPRVTPGLPEEGLGGSLHIHSTDAAGEWTV